MSCELSTSECEAVIDLIEGVMDGVNGNGIWPQIKSAVDNRGTDLAESCGALDKIASAAGYENPLPKDEFE